MEILIVDASVAAKWVLTEPETAVALELLHGPHALAAPEHLRWEVASAITRRFRLGELSEEPARIVCHEWDAILSDGLVRLVPIDESSYHMAVDLAFRTRHALLDCFYLAAARLLGATLVTADRTLYERAQGVHERVTLLAKAA
ncbi:MAG: type II toxin-antitoxin system VapC family toxin [Phycisphaerales bacterium]